jgi:hypothetical protein
MEMVNELWHKQIHSKLSKKKQNSHTLVNYITWNSNFSYHFILLAHCYASIGLQNVPVMHFISMPNQFVVSPGYICS